MSDLIALRIMYAMLLLACALAIFGITMTIIHPCLEYGSEETRFVWFGKSGGYMPHRECLTR